MMFYPFRKLLPFLLLAVLLTACSGSGTAVAPSQGSLPVVATTTIVADVVRQVGGDLIQVEALLPYGVDPHSFEPTPQDMAKVARASLVFANGAGLEEFMQPLLDNAGGQALLVEVSEGITLLEGGEHDDEGEEGEEAHDGGDPHTWFDPNLVLTWVDNIEKALIAADPQRAAGYSANAGAYRQELRDLDAWIRQQVDSIPPEQRKLVSDHTSFTYFATRYGFEQVGAVIPGYSTLAQSSAQELAQLQDTIRQLNVRAVFVGKSENSAVVEGLSRDTGIQLVPLYNGSLSEPGGPATTYLDFMRYDVNAIVTALAPGE